MKNFSKAQKISLTQLNPLFIDDEFIDVEVTGDGDKYEVTNNFGLWRCTCPDYTYRGVGHEDGSYLCKHCISVLLNLDELRKQVNEQEIEETVGEFTTAEEVGK